MLRKTLRKSLRKVWRCHACGSYTAAGKTFCWGCGTLRDPTQKFIDNYRKPPIVFIPTPFGHSMAYRKNIKEVISTGIEKVGTAFLSKSKKGVVIRLYGEGGAPDEYFFTSVQSVNDILSGEKPYINISKGVDDDAPKA